jgi:putative flippase GtrA
MRDRDIIRFVFVGVVNTAFGYSLFSLFLFLGFLYPVAIFFSTIIGIAFNYQTIGRYVFRHRGKSKLLQFFGVYLIVYALNVYGIWQLELFGIDNKYISGALLILPMALISFILNKKVVFRE